MSAGRRPLPDNPRELSLRELIASIRLAAVTGSAGEKQAQFAEADRQAATLLGRVRRVWETVVADRREEERELREAGRRE